MTSTLRIGCLVALAALSLPAPARADEPVLLGIEGAFAMPVTSPQFPRFGPGGSIGLALHLPLASWIAPVVRARAVILSDGPPPADVSIRDPGVGTAFSLTAGLRLRPRGWFDGNDPRRATDFWLEVNAGATVTGTLVRPVFEVGVGYGFEVDDVRLGPSVRLMHVPQWDDPIDNGAALIIMAGLELVLFDRRLPIVAIVEPPPIGDRDGDSILDNVDACPDEPEDMDGWQDEDGCPDDDDDGDGIADHDDACPRVAEDMDGWQDEDGCPEDTDDRDHDGIVDHLDACPSEPETVNGIDDTDGCPDAGLIELIDHRVVIEETVLFDFGRAHVHHDAHPILQAIVTLWRQHPEWTRMRVEGHTDARGSEELNQRLSEHRAAQVRDVLVSLGMPAEQIEVVGHGPHNPRDRRSTEEAYERNRRVEFVALGPDDPD